MSDDTFPDNSYQSKYTGVPWDDLPSDGYPGLDNTPVPGGTPNPQVPKNKKGR